MFDLIKARICYWRKKECNHVHCADKKQRVVMTPTSFDNVADIGWRRCTECKVCGEILKEEFKHTGAIQGMKMSTSDQRIFDKRGWVPYDRLFSVTKRTYS
jgi:hypothetical protein